jgi:hypothetical protein
MRYQPITTLDDTRSTTIALEHPIGTSLGSDPSRQVEPISRRRTVVRVEPISRRRDLARVERDSRLELAAPLLDRLIATQGLAGRRDEIDAPRVRHELFPQGVHPEMNRGRITRTGRNDIETQELASSRRSEDAGPKLGPIAVIDLLDDSREDAIGLNAHPILLA